MKSTKILTLLVVLAVMVGGAAAAVTMTDDIGETEFEGYDDGEVDSTIEVEDGTVDMLESTDTIEVTQTVNFSDIDEETANETLVIDVHNEAISSISESPTTSQGDYTTAVVEVGNETTDVTYNLTLRDSFVAGDRINESLQMTFQYDDGDLDNETVVEGTSYDFVVTASETGFTGGTAFDVPMPEFLESLGGTGLFLVYGLIIGSIILGALALYLVYDRRSMSKNQKVGAYAAISIGSLGATMSQPVFGVVTFWMVLVAFIVLLAVVIYLYMSTDEGDISGGTQYIN